MSEIAVEKVKIDTETRAMLKAMGIVPKGLEVSRVKRIQVRRPRRAAGRKPGMKGAQKPRVAGDKKPVAKRA